MEELSEATASRCVEMLYFTCLLYICLASSKKYLIETEPREGELEAEFERVEMQGNSSSGDYSSAHDDCSIRLICRVSKKRKDRIKSGSCYFRYNNIFYL